MSYLYLLSCLCLTITAIGCVLATFSRHYPDNLLERIGFGVLAMGCASRVSDVWAAQHVNPDWLMVHGGMALVTIGVAWKTARAAHWDGRKRRRTDFSAFDDRAHAHH